MSAVLHASAPGSVPSREAGQTSPGRSGTPEDCFANISPRERRRRLAAGVVQFVISLVILAALLATGVDRWWRLPLLLLFWGAATGFFQWRDKT